VRRPIKGQKVPRKVRNSGAATLGWRFQLDNSPSKSETRRPKEIRRPNSESDGLVFFCLRVSACFRISDFGFQPAGPALRDLGERTGGPGVWTIPIAWSSRHATALRAAGRSYKPPIGGVYRLMNTRSNAFIRFGLFALVAAFLIWLGSLRPKVAGAGAGLTVIRQGSNVSFQPQNSQASFWVTKSAGSFSNTNAETNTAGR
jgi:hypothetical protein